MGVWSAGLATRASAERASKWGGIACLVQAARMIIGIIVLLSAANKPLDNAIAYAIGASVVPVIFVVAGGRLLRCQGRISGSLAAVVLALDLVFSRSWEMTIPNVSGIVVQAMLLIFIVNGVRGAVALRTVDYTTDVRNVFS